MDPLLAISFDSFTNIWYWILTGIAWSVTCHNTLGVPYDSLVRAHQKGARFATEAEELALLNVARVTYVFRRASVGIIVVTTFLLAVLATFGFFYNYELAQAAFALLAPLCVVHGAGVALAFRIEREVIRGSELRRALTKRRFWNQVIGLFSIFCAAFLTLLSLVRGTMW